jgi:NSS family neurotransmitter:Na+ symporter
VGYLFRFAVGFFNGMSPVEIAEYFDAYRAQGNVVALQGLVLLVIITLVLLRGVRKGLEILNNVSVPILLLILLALCARSLTLPNIEGGLEFYLKPDISKFTINSVVAALGQALFSVGVGIGCGIVFGSYLPKDGSSMGRKAASVCIGDTIVAFLAGLMIFPAIFSFGLQPNSGAGLLFSTLPNVFNQLPFGNIFAVLTVILFMLAMLTSQIACLEAVICFADDQLHISRRKTLAVLTPIIAALIWLNAFSPTSFDNFDWYTSNIMLNGGALISAVFFGWVWGPERALKEAGITSHQSLWAFLLKYAIPLAVASIFVTSFLEC